MIPMDRKSPVDIHIGQRLKEYRQHRGMTVRELADAAHVTPGQISRYEHGRDRISHERVTEFARILRIKSNDLYQPPGSRLRRNHVRWRLTNFMAAVIAEAAALMSSRRKAAADNEATMVAAVAVAVGASAAAASDAGAGEKSSLTTSADDTAVDISGSLSSAALKFNPIWHGMAETVTDKERIIVVEGKLEISGAVSETIFRADAETTLQLDASDAANALLIMDGANTDTINLPGHYTINAAESQGRGGKVAYDPPMSAAGEQASAQSTSAENRFIVSNPLPFTETASGNKDHSAFQFKPSMDHHAVTDSKINDITKVAVGASAAAASDAVAGEKFSLTTSADSLSRAALNSLPTCEQASAQSTSAENRFIVSNPLPFTETASGNKDHSAFQFKPSMDHHAVTDSKINDITKVAVGASAAAASDAVAGEKFSLTTSADSLSGAALKFNPAGEQASAQSTSAENGFIVSNPFPFTETASGNKDHSAFQFKPSMDHHAVTDSKINDITKVRPEHPAHRHSDNFKFADNDDHLGTAAHDDSKVNDITKEHPEHPAHRDTNNYKFADNDDHLGTPAHDDSKINDIAKVHPEHPAHRHSDNFKFADNDDHPGTAAHDDSKINDITKEHPEHPAHPHSDNLKFADNDDHPDKTSHDD